MKWLHIGLTLVAATAFAIAVQAGVWWSVGDVTIGPFGFGGDSRGQTLARITEHDLWLRSAIATGVAGALASFLLIVVAGALAANRTPRLLVRMTLSSIVTAAACGTYFVAKFPGVEGAHLDRGALLFLVGIIAGIATCVLVIRRARTAG
jgi:hypothetical protein